MLLVLFPAWFSPCSWLSLRLLLLECWCCPAVCLLQPQWLWPMPVLFLEKQLKIDF